MIRSQIIGVGSYTPSRIVTNHELSQMIDTSDEWIVQRTGIHQRHWANVDQSTSDLALRAAEKAIENSGLQKSDIDMLILATLSPDHEFPGTGCYFQAKLGIPTIPALDVRQQCCGFIYGLSIADQFIRSGMYRNILLVGSEVHSKGLDHTSKGRDVTVLFGDGAGAVVLSAHDVKDAKKDSYIYSTHLHADGRFADALCILAPGTGMEGEKEHLNHSMLDKGFQYPRMDGKKVFVSAVRKMSGVVLECLEANHIPRNEVDLFLFHQANLRINEAVSQQLEIPWDRVFNTIHKYGNTTAATIPLGMDEAIKEGKLQKGMLVMIAAFGSGFTWASGLFRF